VLTGIIFGSGLVFSAIVLEFHQRILLAKEISILEEFSLDNREL
jgi:hypothetical protein